MMVKWQAGPRMNPRAQGRRCCKKLLKAELTDSNNWLTMEVKGQAWSSGLSRRKMRKRRDKIPEKICAENF